MMKKLFLLLIPFALFANIKIAVSYPYIGELTKKIGKDNVDIITLAKGNWDPHFVVPRPSLISKVRNADALIMNGGQLEIGWLPPLLERAGNPKVQVGGEGFLNLFDFIQPLEKPIVVDRSCGDVHPDGNPHYNLDPKNILLLADKIKTFLIILDFKNKQRYEQNYASFSQIWKKKIQEWKEKMASKKGLKVLQYHTNMAYFINAYGLQSIGTIEPLPGVLPSSKHTMKLIQLIEKEMPYAILHDVYHAPKTAKFIASKTGIKILTMPHDVGALENIDSLEALFDYLVGSMQ